MKFTGKPVIIEGRLALKEINPLGEQPVKLKCETFLADACDYRFPCCFTKWVFTEKNLQTLFVSKSEAFYQASTGKIATCNLKYIEMDATITADIENNELINLEIV